MMSRGESLNWLLLPQKCTGALQSDKNTRATQRAHCKTLEAPPAIAEERDRDLLFMILGSICPGGRGGQP